MVNHVLRARRIIYSVFNKTLIIVILLTLLTPNSLIISHSIKRTLTEIPEAIRSELLQLLGTAQASAEEIELDVLNPKSDASIPPSLEPTTVPPASVVPSSTPPPSTEDSTVPPQLDPPSVSKSFSIQKNLAVPSADTWYTYEAVGSLFKQTKWKKVWKPAVYQDVVVKQGYNDCKDVQRTQDTWVDKWCTSYRDVWINYW
jgi:hypothetical protein